MGKKVDQVDIEDHLKFLEGMFQDIIQSFFKTDRMCVEAFYFSLRK